MATLEVTPDAAEALVEANSRGDLQLALAAAGAGWALVDLARHLRDPRAGERALSAAGSFLGAATGMRWSRETRALGALTHLALLDASVPLDRPLPVGSPHRVARLAWHRLTGR